MAEIVDPFHRALDAWIVEQMNDRAWSLAGGSAAVSIDDRRTVGEKYAAAVGYHLALQNVRERCREISAARYGDSPLRDDQRED